MEKFLSNSSYSIVTLRRRRQKRSSAAQQKTREVKQPDVSYSAGRNAMQVEQNASYNTVYTLCEDDYEN